MAHSQMQEHIVFRWMSLKSTIEQSVMAWIGRTGAIGIEYGEHQCRAHQRRYAAGRAARQAEPDCHPADAGSGG